MEDDAKKNHRELIQELAQKREVLRTFRFNIAGSKSRNVREGRNLRREIARLLTRLNQGRA